MLKVEGKELNWFGRVKREIENNEGIMKYFEGIDYRIFFYESDMIPTIKIFNIEGSASITFKVDEERGEIYKEINRVDEYNDQPFKIRVVYNSVEMFLSDIFNELGDHDYPKEYISGWC